MEGCPKTDLPKADATGAGCPKADAAGAAEPPKADAAGAAGCPNADAPKAVVEGVAGAEPKLGACDCPNTEVPCPKTDFGAPKTEAAAGCPNTD